jgi:hypothetical protein
VALRQITHSREVQTHKGARSEVPSPGRIILGERLSLRFHRLEAPGRGPKGLGGMERGCKVALVLY